MTFSNLGFLSILRNSSALCTREIQYIFPPLIESYCSKAWSKSSFIAYTSPISIVCLSRISCEGWLFRMNWNFLSNTWIDYLQYPDIWSTVAWLVMLFIVSSRQSQLWINLSSRGVSRYSSLLLSLLKATSASTPYSMMPSRLPGTYSRILKTLQILNTTFAPVSLSGFTQYPKSRFQTDFPVNVGMMTLSMIDLGLALKTLWAAFSLVKALAKQVKIKQLSVLLLSLSISSGVGVITMKIYYFFLGRDLQWCMIASWISLKENRRYPSFFGLVVILGSLCVDSKKKLSFSIHSKACLVLSQAGRPTLQFFSNYSISLMLSGYIFSAKVMKSFLATLAECLQVREKKLIRCLFIKFVSSSTMNNILILGSVTSLAYISWIASTTSLMSNLAALILGKFARRSLALSWFWQKRNIAGILGSDCRDLQSSSSKEAAQMTLNF